MNMIVNTSELVGYEAETKITKASGTQALAKLISTWERKQAVAKRLGGFGLLAVSLAACNNDDDTSAADATALAAVQAQLASALAAQATAEAAQATAEAATAAAEATTAAEVAVANANQTFLYTTGVETFTGGDGNDNFNSDTAAKFGMLDGAVGGAGTDTLSIADASNNAYSLPTSASISGIENIVVSHTADAVGDAITVNVNTMTDVENVTVTNSGTAVPVNIDTTSNATVVTVSGDAVNADITTVAIDDNGAAATATVAGADVLSNVSVSGTTGAVTIATDVLDTLTLSGIGALTTVTDATVTSVRALTLNVGAGTITGVTDAGADTVTINSTGAVTNTGNITVAQATTVDINADFAIAAGTLTAAAATAVNISGDSKVTMDLAIATTTAVTVSGSAGLTDITQGNAVSYTNSGTGAVTLGDTTGTAGLLAAATYAGGSGVDTVSFGAQTKASTMGAGNDVAYFTGSALAGGSVDMGDGTDKVGLTHANAILATSTEAFETAVTNFESVTFGTSAGDGTINMANLGDATAIEFSATLGHNTTLSNIAAGSTVTMKAALGAGNSITHNLASTTGTTDSHSLVMSNVASTDMRTQTIAGVETINITATDSSPAAADQTAVHPIILTAAAATDVIVTGNAGLNVTATGSTKITNFDASGVTTNAAAVAASAASSGVTYTSLNTTLTALPVIKGGAGADTLTGAAAAVNETFHGGAGIDTINGRTGTDTINGDAGNDIIQFTSAELLGLDIVDGGDGTDVISVTDASTVVDADFANITNIETLTLVAGQAHTLTLGASALAAGVKTVNATGAGNNAITVGAGFAGSVTINSGTGVDTITLSGVTAGNTITVGLGATGANEVLLGAGSENITGGAGVVDTLTVGVGSYLSSSDMANGDTGVDIVAFTAAATITDDQFTGLSLFETVTTSNNNTSVTLAGQAQEAGIVTLTAGNGTNTLDASAYTVAIAITGGTGVDTISGGSGNDTLDGGNGLDTFIMGASAAAIGTDAFGTNLDLSGANADKFDVSAFLPNHTFNAVTVQHNGVTEIGLNNAIVRLAAANGNNTEVNSEAKVAALIEGIGDALHLTSGGKGIVIAGDDSGARDGFIYFVDDTLDGVSGTVSTADVKSVATFTEDLSGFTAGNFV